MKNIPRIFVGDNAKTGMIIPLSHETSHYLTHVMRTKTAIVFGGGHEFNATIDNSGKNILVGDDTKHNDPTGDITLYFAPIKRTDDLINMATQMGVLKLVPVITEHTTASHINWERMKKIAIEAAEQSNRNSVPQITEPIKFQDLDLSNIAFADERAAYGKDLPKTTKVKSVLVGPEGGFSTKEFAALDNANAIGISLGQTILRAELAAAIAISKITQ
ncbi:MAG: 16S rRNA (uracil(1498)-N(3))-methyltransferase [Alphaproteobacteria bacterium]|nr:16S rRNA (uracil(1498)-N(3))-methyltransferase [Alphaproteobacteria bacterium]